MDANLKAKWIDALRSGEYEQARNTIGDIEAKSLCCLGVGAVAAEPSCHLFCTENAVKILFGFDEWRFNSVNPEAVAVCRLIEMNDSEGKNFSEIADYIEQNL